MNNLIIIPIIVMMVISCSGNGNSDTQQNAKQNETKKNNVQTTSNKVDSIQKPKVTKFEIVRIFNHDTHAFTQGLIYHNGYLYESTGQRGQSSLRKINPKTGEVIKKIDIADEYFAEGLALYKNKLYQLTWVSHICFIYDFQTFKKNGSFDYDGEGWGITNNNDNLIMSDGTNMLRFIDPVTYNVTKSIPVVDNNGSPVFNLNELEYVNGEIWANIWQTNRIARIDASTGVVNEFIDFSELWNYLKVTTGTDVLNGIAYDYDTKTFYITGKNWDKMFEIKF